MSTFIRRQRPQRRVVGFQEINGPWRSRVEGSIYYQDDHEQDAAKIPGIRRSPHLLRTVIVNPGEADWAA